MAGIYIHIPYCKRKCAYCDFYSTPATADIDDYINAVVKEAAMQRHFSDSEPMRTLYVGGGTPSLMSTEQFKHLIDGVVGSFDLRDLNEFTIEVNPDDVRESLIKSYGEQGVNRISMGVQSFIDSELAFMGRRHDAQGAITAINSIKAAGIANVSIDLIYGIPGQTIESWTHSIDCAIASGVNHISAYNLSYEPGTRLWVMRQNGKVKEIDDQLCLEMYALLVERLREARYEHYEISNFAKADFRSHHNSSYWDFTPYLGLGAAAHSFDGQRRYSNPCSIRQYKQLISQGQLATTAEDLEWWEQYDEMVMLRLRVSDGLAIDWLTRRFGDKVSFRFKAIAEGYITQGLMKCNNEGKYSLTEHGVMMADSVIRDLMWDVT